MKLGDTYLQLVQSLAKIYDAREAGNIADWVIEKYMGKTKMQRILDKNVLLSIEQINTIQLAQNELVQCKPVQYVLGETWFYGYKLRVNEHVLIPRPETEELVDWIKQTYQKDAALQIIDIGTGSGCMAIALAKLFPNAIVTAIDVSVEALEIAKGNAKEHDVAINFKELNFLDIHTWNDLGNYDIIISNPPYIPQHEMASMHQNVWQFEPHIALFVPDNQPLIFYEAIAQFAEKRLSPNGQIFVEISEHLGVRTQQVFEQKGFVTTLKKDIQLNDRMIKATR